MPFGEEKKRRKKNGKKEIEKKVDERQNIDFMFKSS